MTSAKNIIIGTRKSELALAQSYEIQNLIFNLLKNQNYPDFSLPIKGFKTTGDKIIDKSLSEIGGKGLFTKEIEEALLSKKISLATHSMKDMPANCPAGLGILAVTEREDPRDAFISLKYKSITELPHNAVVGTSSTRRKAILLRIRPDLKIVNFRGNVNTRLEKLENNEVDATILAVSGLKRIKLENYITSIIPTEIMLPAVGQGTIAVQCCLDDEFLCNILKKINHQKTSICIEAERAFLREIDGSCKTPIAGYCQIQGNSLHLKTLVATPDGKEIYETTRIGSFADAGRIGQDAGLETKKNAKHILDLF